jgi:transposase InsO family protein
MKGPQDRKLRAKKQLPAETVRNAAHVIMKYTYFGGLKGTAYMIYHRLGLLSRHIYDTIKKIIRRLIFQEIVSRKLLPKAKKYEHERPQAVGEIWAEDFTQVSVSENTFYISLVIDSADSFYLGAEVCIRPSDFLVSSPIKQALEHNHGKPPKRFLLSDNGRQYVSKKHELLLKAKDIAHKLIPSCRPEYNGTMECGVKEFKNVFYNLWCEKYIGADKEKNIIKQVRKAVAETVVIMNTEIPRPHLKGVTPHDVHSGSHLDKIEKNWLYCEKEKEQKHELIPKERFWDVIKEAIGFSSINDMELMTKFLFFGKRPLRKLSKLVREGVG